MENIILLNYLGDAKLKIDNEYEIMARIYVDGNENYYYREAIVLIRTDSKEWVLDGPITKVIKLSDAEYFCHCVFYCPDEKDTYQLVTRWHPTNLNNEEYGIKLKSKS